MTASALADAQMQWYLADPRISEEHAPLLASAFSAESTEEQRKYATTRLVATQNGAQALETITAAFSGDGNSYWSRRMRAMRQRRDRLGRFAEQGGGMRLLVRTGDGSVRWLTGRSVGAAADSNTFDVETPKGIVRVPASSAEGIEAYLPGKTQDGYSPTTARTTAADEPDIIAEANLDFVDSPAGWEAVENFQGNAGEKAFSDGVYTVAQTDNKDGSKSYRLIDENGDEVAKGDNWTSMLDESIKDALGGAEAPSEITEDMLLSGLDEIANNGTAGAMRGVAENVANFLRDGTAPSDRTPEQLAEQARNIADVIAGDKETTNPNQKIFAKKFQGFEDDFRNGADAITKKLGGQQIQQDKREENQQPLARLNEETAPAPEVPQGAYELEQGNYIPSGRVTEDSTDFTDDPETLATKFKPQELANALQEALIGDSPDRINGLGYGGLEFNEGIEEVPAEALYFALKKQGKNADKFVADTYAKGQARLDRVQEPEVVEEAEPIAEIRGEDVADALDRVKDIPEVGEVTPAKGEQPIEDVNTAKEDAQEEDPNYPALIEGLTEDELQGWVDSGFDHVPFLPSNEDIRFPEGYTQIDPNPIALEDITTVEEGDALNQEGVPAGWTDDPYVLAQDFASQDLIDSLEFALESRDEDSEYSAGKAPFSYTDENGDEFVMEIAPENIRDALQLQGEDTNEILQEIADRAWASQAENKPVASDVEEGRSSGDLSDEEMQAMMDGEGIEPELDKPEVPSGIITEAQPEPERIGEPNAERASRLSARADELASAGKPARASVYRLRGLRDGEGVRLYTSAGEGNVSLPVGDVETANSFTPSAEATRLMQEGGITPLTMHELKSSPENAAIFSQAITDAKNANEFGASVFIYTPEEYADMRMFISADGKSGFALKGTDLVSVFKGDTQDKRVAHAMVPLAIQEGAITGDAFDTTLPEIYGDHGLKTVARLPWDDTQAPSDWNKDTFADFNNGEPDVTFMAYDPDDTAGYTAGQGEMFSDYGDAVDAQQKVVVPEQTPREEFIIQDPPMDGTLLEDVWGPNTESNLPSKASIVKFSAPVTSMQPGDVTIGDNFTITEVGTQPDARGKISVKGYFPGHEVQEKFWKNTTPINFVRGIPEENMPLLGNLPKINKPLYGDFTGGSSSQEFKLAYAKWRGMINAARARWSNRYGVASYEFDASTDIHRVKVHTNELKPGDVMADPTKGNFVIVSVSDPNPDNPDHADAISEGLLVVKGYYPGHELQEKKWKPRQEGRNGREYKMEVIRNSELPESGPLPAINQGEVIDGRYVRNTDPEFVKQYNQNLANAASLYNFPVDAPEVDYPQEINPALREAPRAVPTREPRSPFDVSDPFAQGAFAQMMRDAGSWEQLRENMKGMTFTFFDYETTGLDPNTENPVQLGAVKIRDGVVVDRFNMYMNPGRPLEGWSKDNLKDGDGNPLSDEFLQQQASMEEAHQAFADWAGADTILGAQNSRFDRSFLENALSNTGVDFTPTGYIDPQSLARAINADTGNPRKGVALGKLAEEYGVSLENWHSADADAEAAALIFGKLLDRAQAENLATGQFDVDAIATKHAEDLAFYDSVTYPNYLRDLEAWNMAQAVDKALGGQEVDVEQLIKDSKDTTSTITPEVAEDIAGVGAAEALDNEPSRLATPEWVNNDANTRPVDREDVRANSLQVGDFMRTRKGDRWSQVVRVEEVEDNRFAIHRVDLESGDEFVSGPYWGATRLDNVRRPISPDSLKTGDKGDPTLTQEVKSNKDAPTKIEHVLDSAGEYSAETTINTNEDGSLSANTKLFDEDGDLIDEKTSDVSSMDEAQTFGDTSLQELHDEILGLIEELEQTEEKQEPTIEERPSEISDVTYPTQRSEEIVFDKDANAYRITIMQMPKRFGGGYEVGVFKDSGLSNWEEAPDVDNFQRFETLEDAKSASKEISKSLQPEVKTPKKPVRSNQQKIEENRARIQNGARLVLEVRGDFGDESYVWDNPDGSTVPLDMNDPEQAGDLTLGRLFGVEGDRVVESPEDVTTALLGKDLSDLSDDDQEGTEEPDIFEPGTPVDGNIVLEGGTVVAPQRVVGPDGREYDVAALLLPRMDGSPERYEIVAVDPNNPNRRATGTSAATLGEARALHQNMVNGLADGSIQPDYNFDANTDVTAVTAGDSSPYTTDEKMMRGTPAMRRRIIGNKAFRAWQARNNIYADGVNQARIGDRVVHSYDGWNSRGEGTVVGWHIVENSGDIPREGYAIVAFRDGSYAIWSNRMLFLNGRTAGMENRTDYEPPKEIETRPNLDPMRREQYALTNKYIVKRSRRNRDGTYQVKIYPYISKAQGRQVGETRRAYRMWGEILDQINDYRRQNGLPVLTQGDLPLVIPDANTADGRGRIWIRMMGGTPPTPPAPPVGPSGDNNGGGGTPPVTPPSTPTPTVEPSAPEGSPDEPRSRTQEIDDFVNGFNSTPENLSNELSVENPNIDFVFISDDTNPNNSVGIEWAEDNQAWSIQVVNGNTPEELRYNTDLDEAGAYATTRLLDLREGTNAPDATTTEAPPAPTADDAEAELLRGTELRNFVEYFNTTNRAILSGVKAVKVSNIVIIANESEGKTVRVRWNDSSNSWMLQTVNGDTSYSDLDDVITPALSYLTSGPESLAEVETVEPTGLATLPQNPLTVAQRFLNRSIDKLFPVSGGTGTGRLKGVIYRNFDAVDPNSAKNQNNQPLTQQDFVANGHQSVRAAELAHAANNRPSADYIQNLLEQYSKAVFGSDEKKEAKEKLKEAMKAVFGEGNQFGSGTIAINSVEPLGGAIEVKMSIINSNGVNSGFANRVLYFKDGKLHHSYNDHLKINDSSQVKGFSTPFNAFMERWYAANGSEYVDVHAFSNSGDYIGGYIWALDGFNWKDQNVAKTAVSKAIKKALESTNPSVVEDAKKLMAAIESSTGATTLYDIPGGSDDPIDGFPTALDIAMIGYRPGDTKWWGQSYLKGSQGNWYGRKYLNATAPSVLQNFGYQDLKRAREMAERGDNAFTPNSWLNKLFKDVETYFGDGEVLSLYADEYSKVFRGLQPKSVSLLSPPAKEALGKYVATILANGSYLSARNTARSRDADMANTELLINIMDALNKDKMAYQPNQTSLSVRGKELSQIPTSQIEEITGKNISLFHQGKDTGFVVSRLGRDMSNAEGPTIGGPPTGASTSWMVVDSRTGEVFFVKDVGDYKAMGSEVAVNALGRALEIQGLPVVESFGTDPNYIISSEAGTHLRLSKLNMEELQPIETSRGELQPVADTPYLIRAGESANFRNPEVASSELSQVGIINMGIMDIATGNADRNESNTIMVRNHSLDGVDAPAESWIPIPIDHTETLMRYSNSSTIEDYIVSSQGDSMDWLTGLYNKVGPVTFKMMMEKRARIALDNLRQQYGPFMSQQDYEMISQRLQGIIDLSEDGWVDLFERRG